MRVTPSAPQLLALKITINDKMAGDVESGHVLRDFDCVTVKNRGLKVGQVGQQLAGEFNRTTGEETTARQPPANILSVDCEKLAGPIWKACTVMKLSFTDSQTKIGAHLRIVGNVELDGKVQIMTTRCCLKRSGGLLCCVGKGRDTQSRCGAARQ